MTRGVGVDVAVGANRRESPSAEGKDLLVSHGPVVHHDVHMHLLGPPGIAPHGGWWSGASWSAIPEW